MEYPRAIDPRIVNIVTITTYAHPKEAIITGKRNGLTALLYRKTAIGPWPTPSSLSFFIKGYHAKMGPIEIIPAAIESNIPFMPAPLPKRPAI